MTDDIETKIERIEEIIDLLDDGDVSLSRGKELHREGKELLEEIESDLQVGEGRVIEE